MRDDLIGFVLDALDPVEHDEIRRKIERDPELRRQIHLVERSLKPLAVDRDGVAPPEGLAARTCHCLVDRKTVDRNTVDRNTVDRKTGDRKTGFDAPTPRSAPAGWGSDQSGGVVGARHWTMADFVVAAGVCLAAACLFLPALSNSRYNMQLAGCQNKMRQLGASLAAYSNEAGGYFPVIPPHGNLSFSGVYAPKLAAKGLIQDPRVFLCPAKGNTVILRFPPLRDIAAARGPQLVSLHRTMGGDFAYTLGFVKQGHLHGIRNRGDWNVAVLSDAPLENVRNASITTHARGQNVLFADGHVHFLATRHRPGSDNDDLFFNDRGLVLAGLNAEDSVLAPSYVSPFPLPGQ